MILGFSPSILVAAITGHALKFRNGVLTMGGRIKIETVKETFVSNKKLQNST